MAESYRDNINAAFLAEEMPVAASLGLPREIIAQALLLQQETATGQLLTEISDIFDPAHLSPEDQRLFEHRTLGGLSVRLALGSYYVHKIGETAEPFFALSESDQAAELASAAYGYVAGMVATLDSEHIPLNAMLNDRTAGLEPGNDTTLQVPHNFVRAQLHGMKHAELTDEDMALRRRHYRRVLPGSFTAGCLPDMHVGENDALLVQAFGRNTMPDRDLPALRTTYDTLALGDDLRMMQILADEMFEPGESNIALAGVVDRYFDGIQVVEPVIQWEAAYALWQNDPEKYERYRNYIHTVWPKTSFYPTYEVKQDSIEAMDRVGLYNPLELAHPDMTIRALGILSRLGVEPDLVVADIPFDPRSAQIQTRGRVPWTIREMLTRAEHAVRGRVAF